MESRTGPEGGPGLTKASYAFPLRYSKLLEGMKTGKGGDRASEGALENKGRDRVSQRSGPSKQPRRKGKKGKEGTVVEGEAEQNVSEAA